MPDLYPSTDTVTEAVATAIRAPSVHNSQPWKLSFDSRRLDLFTRPERRVPFTDLSGRQLLISCGVLLDHLVASFAALAWTSAVHRFPNPNRRNHLASITFTAAGFVTDAERQRAEAIRKRRTDRLPFRPPAGWDEFSVLLRDVLRDCPVSVDVVPDDARDDLVRASRLAAGLRRYDSMFHAEMQWWITDAASPLGIPANALVTRSEQSRVPLGRVFPTVEHEPRRTGVKLDQSTVLVVSTGRDDELEFVSAGEAVSRILLESTIAGYATCALTHLTEVPECRSIVRDIVGSARKPPQVLVRVGTAPEDSEPAPVTPRLEVSEVLDWTA